MIFYLRSPFFFLDEDDFCLYCAAKSEMYVNSMCVIFQKEFFVELGLTTGQLGIDDSTQVPPGECFSQMAYD